MNALVDFLLTLAAFRERLVELGWQPPIDAKGGGGPGKPKPPQ